MENSCRIRIPPAARSLPHCWGAPGCPSPELPVPERHEPASPTDPSTGDRAVASRPRPLAQQLACWSCGGLVESLSPDTPAQGCHCPAFGFPTTSTPSPLVPSPGSPTGNTARAGGYVPGDLYHGPGCKSPPGSGGRRLVPSWSLFPSPEQGVLRGPRVAAGWSRAAASVHGRFPICTSLKQ